MKRRLVYAFIGVLFVSGLWGLSLEKSHAISCPSGQVSIRDNANDGQEICVKEMSAAEVKTAKERAALLTANTSSYSKLRIQLLQNFEAGSATFQSKYTAAQKEELKQSINALKGIFDMRAQDKNQPKEDGPFVVVVLGDFGTYLKGKIDVEKNQEKKEVLVQLDNLSFTIKNDASAGIYSQGQISALGGGVSTEASEQTIKSASAELVAKTKEDGGTGPGKCGVFGVQSSIIACFDEAFTWFIKVILMNIGGFLVWLFANMFNYAITTGVLNFSDWAPEGLYPLWVVVRQIISLLVVFVGVYLGFWYILGKGEVFEKFIPWLVLYAVFVNFSYPIVRTAIDLSNIITLNLYSTAVGNGLLNGAADPGGIIMAKVGLGGLAASALGTGGTSFLGSIDSTPGALLAVCYVFYMAYIFFRVTLILIGRTVAFVFMIVASPILLVDSVLPLLGERAKWLRKIFFEQLLVGPVFMIMFALTLRFLDVFSSLKGVNVASAAGSSNTVTTFFTMGIMLIMLHIMIRVTESTAGEVGKFATEKLGTVGGFALGAASAGTGFLARKGVGMAAAKVRDSAWVKRNLNENSFVGRRVYDMSNSLAKSTFDLRKSTMVAGGAAALGLSKGMGMTSSIGPKVGYDEKLKNEREDIAARGERIGERYKEDVKDGEGNLIHRKGDFTPKGLEAKTRYNETLGGRSTFMTKEQKEATKELLKEKVVAAMKKDETAIKEIADEKLKEYQNIKGAITKNDGTSISAKEQKSQILTKLQDDLETVKKKDLTLKGSEAQAISAAINTIQEKNKEESDAFYKQIDGLLFRYANMKGATEIDITKKQNDLLNQQDKDVREALLSKITPSTQSSSTSGEAISKAQASSAEIITAGGGQAAKTEAPTETPGFLKTAEDKIRERAQSSSTQTATGELSTPQKSPATIREEKLAAASQAQVVEIQKIDELKRNTSPSRSKKEARYAGDSDFENLDDDFTSIV